MFDPAHGGDPLWLPLPSKLPVWKEIMDHEEPSVRASIDRWMRELTIRGDENLSADDQARLLERVNPPQLENVGAHAQLDESQSKALREGLDGLVACMSYDYAAHMAVDEALMEMLQKATGQSRSEVLQEVGLTLSDVPPLKLDDPTD